MKKHNAFTLIELMVVILIVAVLAAAAFPLMRGRIDRGKWTEANAAAGSIRTAMKSYFMETGNTVTGSLDDASVQQALGVQSGDLPGAILDPPIMSLTASALRVWQSSPLPAAKPTPPLAVKRSPWTEPSNKFY
jgi:prepilin-type N-terminal cleavage/methylation domain-containing protein